MSLRSRCGGAEIGPAGAVAHDQVAGRIVSLRGARYGIVVLVDGGLDDLQVVEGLFVPGGGWCRLGPSQFGYDSIKGC